MGQKKFKVAVICGGPSLERGISLNSARSVCDHLRSEQVEVVPIYFDYKNHPYLVSPGQLYSNTPSDFDFKLQSSAKPLSMPALKKLLKSVDLTFPVIHGPFGEDGRLQKMLEGWGCPFIGSPSAACLKGFDKFIGNEFLKDLGFFSLPQLLVKRNERNFRKNIQEFFRTNKLRRAIVKPATGGSSIAVYSVSTVDEAVKAARAIFNQRVDKRIVIEPFCQGTEFTVIILQNRFGLPVAVMPTEIELDYRDHQIFDYRRKYLATRQVTYHCPPRFSDAVVEQIQTRAEQIFTALGMRDFARIDGWLMPDGNLWFSDINPVSGMEQNSFLFMQTSRIGMSHRDLLRYLVTSACRRHGLEFPQEPATHSKRRKPINVIFGGDTAERQVSLMSGSNVWLKLRRSSEYNPQPFLLDHKQNVWRLPYGAVLNHTVEEIYETCISAEQDEKRLQRLRERVIEHLATDESFLSEPWFTPEKMSLEKFLEESDRVFIGLHGGIGENGELQKMLERRKIPFNGPGSLASRLCMDKNLTGLALKGLESEGISVAKKRVERLASFKRWSLRQFRDYWNELCAELNSKTLIVKPIDDGCSAGIVRLYNAEDLRVYVSFARKAAPFIPQDLITEQHGIVEMPTVAMKNVLFEAFIETDKVSVVNNSLRWQRKNNWIEVTMGVLERGGKMHALSPSITVAVGNVLSLEEKFQGGTGVNITPPPQPFVSELAIKAAKRRMELVAKRLGLQGYSRIDAFMHIKTGELIVIEANTLPGLTASTVIYHQALAEPTPMYPTDFLEAVMHAAERRYSSALAEEVRSSIGQRMRSL